jgi:phosphate transport system permease protein
VSPAGAAPPPAGFGRRRERARASLFVQGEPLVWLMGGGLVIAVVMIVALVALIAVEGFSTFLPRPVVRLQTADGKVFMGEVERTERRPGGAGPRRLVRVGNFELSGEHFRWVDEEAVRAEDRPAWALVIEREEWGRFYGEPVGFLLAGAPAAAGPEQAWELYRRHHDEVRERRRTRRRLETVDIGAVNHRLEAARLDLRTIELRQGTGSPARAEAQRRFAAVEAAATKDYDRIRSEIQELNKANQKYQLLVRTADGREKAIALAEVVRAYPANALTAGARVRVYLGRWLEFLVDDPREANSEGGVFPAIFGTVAMTLVMSIVVVPFGVMAALYLREYARAGAVVSAVRISINNLAGVPSIVFGVFGLAFFCYAVGASVDQVLFAASLPNPTFGKGGILWAALTLALLTLPVVIVATEEALSAVPNSLREGSYACGASKWQTIRRIVLPRALPGIMTGMILAMARGAGEVAPLMLVGAVKLAPELPLDGTFPYVHAQRSFMHLGFHIYDLGFQSQNSEAAKPMVFTTTLLLIGVVFLLNVLAVRLRTRLRRRFESEKF